MKLTISSYSTALFATWYFIEEWGLLLDAGDGLMACLHQKSRKVKNVLISHADRDHITGLLQFIQLNARKDFPRIYYPKDSGSFPFLAEFSRKFDPHIEPIEWVGIDEKSEILLQRNLTATPLKNNHVLRNNPLAKSFGFLIQSEKRKLKPIYKALSNKAIAQLSREKGQKTITDVVKERLLAYSGDTPAENFEQWDNIGVLIHEATFLTKKETPEFEKKHNRHSTLEEVLYHTASLNIGRLILGHFSLRYSADEIDTHIRQYCKEFQVEFPVYRVLPGAFSRDILAGEAVNG